MAKTIQFDVWMNTGVCVRVPAGTDPDTDAGIEAIKAAAVEQFRRNIDEGSFDVEIEPFGDDDE